MALVIEDGTGVSGANSFVTDAEYVAYAAARALTVASTADLREIELIKSMDYLFSKEPNMKGQRTLDAQENVYPRQDVFIRGVLLGNNAIPTELKNAQMEGGSAANGFDLLVNGSETDDKRQKLDTLEIEFFEGGSWAIARTERIDNYLKPLLTSLGLSRVVRA
jgi:hypothetical protein